VINIGPILASEPSANIQPIIYRHLANEENLLLYYTVGHKSVPLYFCPYLGQLLTDFQNSFTSHTLQTTCNNLIIIYPTTL